MDTKRADGLLNHCRSSTNVLGRALRTDRTARMHEDARAAWVWLWAEQARQDVRYALRTLAGSPGFPAIGAGREFTAADTAAAPKMAVVNEAFVRRHLPGRNPVGQRASIAGGLLAALRNDGG